MNSWQTAARWCKEHFALVTIVLFCAANLYFGLRQANSLLTAEGAIGLCYVVLRWAYASLAAERQRARVGRLSAFKGGGKASAAKSAAAPPKPANAEGLVEQMLVQGRSALLLRKQVAATLSKEHFRRAMDALRQTMAMVPQGPVMLDEGNWSEPARRPPAGDAAGLSVAEQGDGSPYASAPGRLVRVERFFLDRFPVTNRLFYEFVAAGGYRQEALWDKAVWPAVPTMLDCSGAPGPRYWNRGCFLPGEEDHPVVGVSWHEAAACARWLGKRLPSDAEWVKAVSWPVPISATACLQRRYPWGDVMDLKHANLWGAGPNRIVPVHEFAEGMSVGGAYQMIGNVWEWTAGNFRGRIAGQVPADGEMKSIRGGAFDTYFDPRAAGQFQSGEDPLQRRHNIGFRCAVGVSELLPSVSTVVVAAAPQSSPAAVQEVSV